MTRFPFIVVQVPKSRLKPGVFTSFHLKSDVLPGVFAVLTLWGAKVESVKTLVFLHF